MKRLFVIAFCSIVLIGCGGSSTDSGATQGTETGFFSGTYEGILELQATADAIGTGRKFVNDSATVEVEITENGVVRLTIDKIRLDGIIDNDGNWDLYISINDFGSLYNKGGSVSVKPEEGKLVVWPNFIMHGSYPYSGKKNRIIVSANTSVSLLENNKPVPSN